MTSFALSIARGLLTDAHTRSRPPLESAHDNSYVLIARVHPLGQPSEPWLCTHISTSATYVYKHYQSNPAFAAASRTPHTLSYEPSFLGMHIVPFPHKARVIFRSLRHVNRTYPSMLESSMFRGVRRHRLTAQPRFVPRCPPTVFNELGWAVDATFATPMPWKEGASACLCYHIKHHLTLSVFCCSTGYCRCGAGGALASIPYLVRFGAHMLRLPSFRRC